MWSAIARIDIALVILGATSLLGLIFSYAIFRTRT